MKQITFIVLTFIIGCNNIYAQQEQKKVELPFRVIGYYMGKPEDVANYEYEKLSHIIFCLTGLKENKISLKDSSDEKTLKLLVAQKQKHPNLKVLVLFGGWGGCQTCSPVFNIDSNRTVFSKSVKDFVLKYNLDGFDMDWESPVIGGYQDHPALPEDKDNFTDLMKKLRKELPLPYEISFDANSFPEYILQSVDWANVMPQVDFVNLMTYDLPNDKSKHTGHHTALYSSIFQKKSVNSGVLLLDSFKVPHNKIIIGAGFFGYVIQGVDSLNFGLGRQCKSRHSSNYNEIIKNYTIEKGYKTYWDTIAKAPYLYSFSERTFITYDNKESCSLKTKYALDNKLGGIMFWRLNGDTPKDGLLNAIYEAKKNYRSSPKAVK